MRATAVHRQHSRPKAIAVSTSRLSRLLPALASGLACLVSPGVLAGPVPLNENDVALSLYEWDGKTSKLVGTASVVGYFGPHRCACPVSLAPQLQLTESGQASIGSSVIGVEFLLGKSCATETTACTSLGKVTFSATQTAAPPSFISSLVYQSAADSAAVNCNALITGATSLWAVLSQDGVPLSFTRRMELDVTAATVGAPAAVTATAGNGGITVQWAPPADASLVAGYQILCLPRPVAATAAAYESCGLPSEPASVVLTPADATQVCSSKVPASQHSIRVAGLVNGTPYAVAVVAIDPSGGTSALSPPASATPLPTDGFYEKYKQAGGAATGCSLGRSSAPWLSVAAVAALLAVAAGCRRRRRRGRANLAIWLAVVLPAGAQGQDFDMPPASDYSSPPVRTHGDDWAANPERSNNDWAENSRSSTETAPPDWGIEIGFSPYRPDVDGEFGGDAHPYTDTFSTGHHLMSEAEIDHYLGHGAGSWGLGLRVGYFRATGSAFLEDGTRSRDETGLRIIPLSLAAVYRGDNVPGLRRAALVPYAKLGLDVAIWTATTTASTSHTGLTPGWHAACGVSLGLNALGLGSVKRGEIAGPVALFFEWDWAVLDGIGMSKRMHVGDSTWYAGLLFDY